MRKVYKHRELFSSLCGDLNGKEIQKSKNTKNYGTSVSHTVWFEVINVATFCYQNCWNASWTMPSSNMLCNKENVYLCAHYGSP